MRVAVPKETTAGERRVALVPETIGKLGSGFDVRVERGAGESAGFADDAYAEAGAELVDGSQLVPRPTASRAYAHPRPGSSPRCRRARWSSVFSSP